MSFTSFEFLNVQSLSFIRWDFISESDIITFGNNRKTKLKKKVTRHYYMSPTETHIKIFFQEILNVMIFIVVTSYIIISNSIS